MAIKSIQKDAEVFPNSHHLVIVTEQNVSAWDALGLRHLFTSESNSILAAKAAGNGNGTLAIADSHLVFLHEVSRGLERSYKLQGAEGYLRLLHFSQDSNVLFFSTTLLNSVQRYSLKEGKLLEPGSTHPSPPTALAVSPKSHILLTASEHPPTIFLQHLAYGGVSKQFIPQVSVTAVTCAAFHPTRPSIFLLAFKDGTLAIYDASKVNNLNGRAATSTLCEYAELKAFSKLHRVSSWLPTSTSSLDEDVPPSAMSLSITGADFLPGCKTKAISVGADGKCNIVDFEKGTILRSWHIKGPATSLSILGLQDNTPEEANRTSKRVRKPPVPKSTCSMRQLIAVGRIDGKVHVYNGNGELRFEKVVDRDASRVIDVSWIAGCPPKAIGESKSISFKTEDIVDLDVLLRLSKLRESENAGDQTHKTEKTNNLDVSVVASSVYSRNQDDVFDLGTVRYTEQPKHTSSQFSNPEGNGYMDLFSPVKQAPPAPSRPSPSRPRPRITSETFISNDNNNSPQSSPNKVVSAPKLELPVRHTLPTSPSKTIGKSNNYAIKVGSVRRGSPRKVSVKTKRGMASIFSVPPGIVASHGVIETTPSSVRSNANSKILADIKSLETKRRKSGVRKIGGNMAILAPYYEPKSTLKIPSSSSELLDQSRSPLTSDSLPLVSNFRAEERSRKSIGGTVRGTKPVRVRMRPRSQKEATEDIWLTDSENEQEQPARRHTRKAVETDDRADMADLPLPAIFNKPQTSPKSGMSSVPSSISCVSVPSHSSESTVRHLSKHSSKCKAKHDPPSSASATSKPTPSSSYFSSIPSTQEANQPSAPLLPGFAESFQGPVNVSHYLPRQASLCFKSPKRTAMGEISGNELRDAKDSLKLMRNNSTKRISLVELHGNALVCSGCAALSADLDAMRDEHRLQIDQLKAELAELCELMNSK